MRIVEDELNLAVFVQQGTVSFLRDMDDLYGTHFSGLLQPFLLVVSRRDLVNSFLGDAAYEHTLAILPGNAPALLVNLHAGITADAFMPVMDDLDQRC